MTSYVEKLVKLFKCPDCGYICLEEDRNADYWIISDEGDEVWSNDICPNCKSWLISDDWIYVNETQK